MLRSRRRAARRHPMHPPATLCAPACNPMCTRLQPPMCTRLQPYVHRPHPHAARPLCAPCVQALGVSTSAEGGGTDFSHLFDLVLVCNLASLLPLFVPPRAEKRAPPLPTPTPTAAPPHLRLPRLLEGRTWVALGSSALPVGEVGTPMPPATTLPRPRPAGRWLPPTSR